MAQRPHSGAVFAIILFVDDLTKMSAAVEVPFRYGLAALPAPALRGCAKELLEQPENSPDSGQSDTENQTLLNERSRRDGQVARRIEQAFPEQSECQDDQNQPQADSNQSWKHG